MSGIGLTVIGWAVGLVATAIMVAGPSLVSGYRSTSLHLVLDSVDACAALLVAYLVHGRLARGGSSQDLLLAQGFVLLAIAGFGLTYAAETVTGERGETVAVWLSLTVRVLGASLIAAAALADTRPATKCAWRRSAIILPVAAVVLVSLVLWPLRTLLPAALDVSYSPTSAEQPILTGHPVLVAAQGWAALCFFLASIAFARQSARRDDQLLRWLGPACALAAFSRVDYALFPSLYTDWLYTGDLLRTGSYLLLVVGATRELKQYWETQPRTAVQVDRRRLARELHDGVIQELGYIRSTSHDIPAELPVRHSIISACDRALDEARTAVHTLGHSGNEPLGVMLRRIAGELAARYGLRLRVELDDSVHAPPDQQHALMRITQEAVSNAVRHGNASTVCLHLRDDGGGRHLSIRDDGSGFDPTATRIHTGYGLTSMRDRARSLPGSLDIEAAPGSGSTVTVRW